MENGVVVLGTRHSIAESYYNATCGKYHLANLTQRSRRQPDAADSHRRFATGTAESKKRLTILGEKLRTAIVDRLEKGEQTILFLNRRGFSTSLLCSARRSAELPELQRRVTFHRQRRD